MLLPRLLANNFSSLARSKTEVQKSAPACSAHAFIASTFDAFSSAEIVNGRPASFGISYCQSYCQPNDALELVQVEQTARSKAPTTVQQNAQAEAEGQCRMA
jgi:hypothetical protein